MILNRPIRRSTIPARAVAWAARSADLAACLAA